MNECETRIVKKSVGLPFHPGYCDNPKCNNKDLYADGLCKHCFFINYGKKKSSWKTFLTGSVIGILYFIAGILYTLMIIKVIK